MPSKNGSGTMQYTWDFVHRVLIALMVIGFGMAALGLIGEILGWWNDVGQILMTVGTVVGAGAGLVELVGGASEATVEAVREDLGTVDEAVGEVHGAVGDVHEAVGDVEGAVGDVQAAVGGVGEKLGTLDAIEVELDTQTSVLEDIRDGL